MRLAQRTLAWLLATAMLLTMPGLAIFIEELNGDEGSQLVLVDENGNETEIDNSWAETYPYGGFALQNSELALPEDGEQQVLTVYRLGGTTGRARVVLDYQPNLTGEEDEVDYSYAISADDFDIWVEDARPITQYQEWGVPPTPERTEAAVIIDGTDEVEGELCSLLRVDTDAAVSWQWYALYEGVWQEVVHATEAILPVADADLETYDFRCIFTTEDGTRYCTDSYQGVAYVPEGEAPPPEAPDDIDLNPAPSYTRLQLEDLETSYTGFYFTLDFADGEYKKDILLAAKEDGVPEVREYATITIVDHKGGDIVESMTTLMLAIEDGDAAVEAPTEVGFDVTDVRMDKSDGTAYVTVRRTGGMSKAVSADWYIEEGTAEAGVDFVDRSGIVAFYGSTDEVVLEIELINDQVESWDERTFELVLENLRGDDSGFFTEARCTVSLYNSNTAQQLNLPSVLAAVDAVDVSAELEETEGAIIHREEIIGEEVVSDPTLDALENQTTTIEWFDGEEGDGLDPEGWYGYNNNTGEISFSGGEWTSTKTHSLSLKSKGDEKKTETVYRMGSRFKSVRGYVTGGADFSSGWYRTWHGDEEYGYTAFSLQVGNATTEWDCSPRFYRSKVINIHLEYYSKFSVYHSWNYTKNDGKLILEVKTHEDGKAEDPIDSAASMTLTRRTFDNKFKIGIHTANDSDVANVPHYNTEHYANLIESITVSGGATGGKLYVGSTFTVNLGNTGMILTDAWIATTGAPLVHVHDGVIDSAGRSVTFKEVDIDPSKTYIVQLVYERQQKIKIDISPSMEINTDGTYKSGAADAAQTLLRKRLNGGSDAEITYGYGTNPSSNTAQLWIPDTFDKNYIITTNSTMKDAQWVNFGLPAEDIILFNGKAYAGNETIRFEAGDITPDNLTFYYYHEDFIAAERPMRATLDATALYFDANGNGYIDGYWDADLGIFVLDETKDRFIDRLDSVDYVENRFLPDSEGRQYFIRSYYNANPVCLIVPEGHEDSERMQVMPNFITDVTDSTQYAALTDEQKAYRTVVSGQTKLSSNDELHYSADDHLKYGPAASAYSYVDMPLGGDKAPARHLTPSDIGGLITQVGGQYTYNGERVLFKDGHAYYYEEDGAKYPNNLGNGVFHWSPSYTGQLLYPYSAPQLVTIPKTIAGDNFPVTEYSVDSAEGKAAINAYLGSFGGNDTFALAIQEQELTTNNILARAGSLEVLETSSAPKSTVTRGQVGTFPDPSYNKQMDGQGAEAEGSSEGKGDYEEFSSDGKPEVYSFSAEGLAVFSIEVGGYDIYLSVGLPVHSADGDGATGSSANTWDDVADAGTKAGKFISAIAKGESNPFSNLVGDNFDSDKMKSKGREFTVTVSFGVTLRYNALDNSYQFAEAALSAAASIEVRLQYRFTALPILYVYAQFSASGSVATGLGQDREAVLGESLLGGYAAVTVREDSSSGNQFWFVTGYKGFSMTFDGTFYMEIRQFNDTNNNGLVDDGETGEVYPGTHSGYISSDGKEPTEYVFKRQDGFKLKDDNNKDVKVIVLLTAKDHKDKNDPMVTEITSLNAITNVKQDLYWTGLRISIEGGVEVGIGIGVEVAKVEIFAKAGIGFTFSLLNTSENNKPKAWFDEFSLSAGLGFRVVLLFFSYEQDLIEIHLTYERGEGWKKGWSACGGKFGKDSDAGLYSMDTNADGEIDFYLTGPSAVRAQTYSNNVTGREGDLEELAYPGVESEFEVSGYGSSVSAYKLIDNVATGYDYRVVTVGNDNYIVYTGTRTGGEPVDQTRLQLSKLKTTGLTENEPYGLVYPVAGQSTTHTDAPYLVVDNDAAGDLDFTAWADGTTIHVMWVSYASPTAEPVAPPRYTVPSGMTAENYKTATKPDGGTYVDTTDPATYVSSSVRRLVINGTEVTLDNYTDITLDVKTVLAQPAVGDYYLENQADATAKWGTDGFGTYTEGTPTKTYYYPKTYESYAAAVAAYEAAVRAYNNSVSSASAYQSAITALADWKAYYAWYAYYAAIDVQNQMVAASRNTVVKHATFDTTADTAFSAPVTVADQTPNTGYYFLPRAAGQAAVAAQSVPYSDAEMAAKLDEYEEYITKAMTPTSSTAPSSDPEKLNQVELDNTTATQSYIKSTIALRVSYQESMLAIYGGNSVLTVTAPDGTAYANGTMSVSHHSASDYGGTDGTDEILTNVEVAQVGTDYYLAYITQQDVLMGDETKDLCSTYRLYLRHFTIAADTVTWGDPYLLRTLVNFENDSSKDGLYVGGALKDNKAYQDPYFANLSFLSGKLGSSLAGTNEEFEPFDVATTESETFLLFEMNGITYVIRQDSLQSITQPAKPEETKKTTGSIIPFFTWDYAGNNIDADSTEGYSSGKNEVVIGADGDGNIAAVYTASVPYTANNAIYISYWDPTDASYGWSDGVMLAMSGMTTYEYAVANNLSAEEAEAAYYAADDDHNIKLPYFVFSNVQFALGRPSNVGVNTQTVEELGDGVMQATAESASSLYGDLAAQLGVEIYDENSLTPQVELSDAELYDVLERAETLGVDLGVNTAPAGAELLVLTQGSLQKLQRTAVVGSTTEYVVTPVMVNDGEDGDQRAVPAKVGIYAISYGKGDQQVGQVSIAFGANEFTADAQLFAAISFKNVGDAAIRGSTDQPITIKLMTSTGQELKAWTVKSSIAPGQTVRLNSSAAPCVPLTSALGEGDYFYLTVAENTAYEVSGGTAYNYNSASDTLTPYMYEISDKTDLGIERITGQVTGVAPDGDAIVELSFDATNRGSALAEDVYVQFSYISGYEPVEVGSDLTVPIYTPLDLTGHNLRVSQQKYITDDLTIQDVTELQNGILRLGTDDTYYTDRYYISAEAYNEILAGYYRTSSFSNWVSGTYKNTTYYYDKTRFLSAYDAYTAGQEAVSGWTRTGSSGAYYSVAYTSLAAAQAAATAARRAEYVMTSAQYDQLTAAARENWAEDSTSGEYYLKGLGSYAEALAAYEAALDDKSENLKANYLRTVEGTINVDPALFLSRIDGSLELQVEVFSKSSSVSMEARGNGTSLHTSTHSDEYYSANNAGRTSILHRSFISSAPRIVLSLGSVHQIPVNVSTSRGVAPNLRVIEVEDGADELSTLAYQQSGTAGGVPSITYGMLRIVGRDLGSGLIHIVDEATNTTYPIAYTVREAGDGVNIFNDDAQFTFYNADGTPYDPDARDQSWKFEQVSAWGTNTQSPAVPYLDNLAIGQKGAYFTMVTQAESFAFDFIGDATLTSNRFPGDLTFSGTGADFRTDRKGYRNSSGVTHTITVKITSDGAWFDLIRPNYGTGYKPSDDPNAPGLYWSRSFPAAGSVKSGEAVSLTVYAVDNDTLQNLSFNGTTVVGQSGFAMQSEQVYQYTFDVTQNGSFAVSAVDQNGNMTSRTVTVDWFGADETSDLGKAPVVDPSGAVYKLRDTDASYTGVTSNTVIPATSLSNGAHVMLRDTAAGVNYTYSIYETNTFSDGVGQVNRFTANDVCMVRMNSNDSSGTWSARIYALTCFEAMPQIELTATPQTAPHRVLLSWSAAKDPESTAQLDTVKLNDISMLSSTQPQSDSFAGVQELRYGGVYTLFASNEKKGGSGEKVQGQRDISIVVPVEISAEGVFATVNAWGQPDATGARYGSITVDFDEITGGEYANQTKPADFDGYYGHHAFTVVTKAEYDAKVLEDEAATIAWLETLAWKTTTRDGNGYPTYEWDGLTVPAGGELAYVVLVRDEVTNKDAEVNYETMAVQEIVLRDIAIDVVSLSARLASGETESDGEVYATANLGLTGAYQFAILPVPQNGVDEHGEPIYTALTEADFKAPFVAWQLADLDSPENTSVTFGDRLPGRYQVAIRALYSDSGDMQTYLARQQTLLAALTTLEDIQFAITADANTGIAATESAHNVWQAAIELAAELKAVYDELLAAYTALDPTVTLGQVNDAYDAWQAALGAEANAATDFKAVLEEDVTYNDGTEHTVGLTAQQVDDILALRAAWAAMEAGEDKDVAYRAYRAKVSETWTTFYDDVVYQTRETAAEGAVSTAQSAYDTAAGTLGMQSANVYNSLEALSWDGMLLTPMVNIGQGTATSLETIPTRSSAYAAQDGTIVVTAGGGSPYGADGVVHYQFAILPIEDGTPEFDYPADPQAFAALNLNWRFADDLTRAPAVATFTDLASGWYRAFVRVAYDPDPRDEDDVNQMLLDPTDLSGNDVATLRAAYEAAEAAADPNALSRAVTDAHALYTVWLESEAGIAGNKNDDAYRAYLDSFGSDGTVIAALEAWEAATATLATVNADPASTSAQRRAAQSAVSSAWNTYRDALLACLSTRAANELSLTEHAYFMRVAQVSELVDRAYAEAPGYYRTGSSTTVQVGFRTSASAIVGITYEGENGLATIELSSKNLTSADQRTIYELSLKRPLLLVLEDLTILVPVGSMPSVQAPSAIINGYTPEGDGSTTSFTDRTGGGSIVPVSVVEEGKAAYLFMGLGSYEAVLREVSFSDIAGHWAESNIRFVAERGLFQGIGNELFDPQGTMTRAMLITVLHRLCGEIAATGTLPFTDVPDGLWYSEAARWGYINGVINGVSDTSFAPGRDVTREQMVTMLYRFLRGASLIGNEQASLAAFPDHTRVSSYAREAMSWAVYAGIILGDDAGRLNPGSPATRAEVAAFFERTIRYILTRA